jgi:glutaredoxin-related protein
MKETTYTLEELIPLVTEMVHSLKNPLLQGLVANSDKCRTSNLCRIAVRDDLVIEIVNKTEVQNSTKPREVRIRVSLKDIRNNLHLRTEIFKFQEIYTNQFIHIPI